MRMSLCVLAIVSSALAPACADMPMPAETMHIDWVREGKSGHYEKAGAYLDGWTCGERYHLAVTGDPEAEALMDDCSRDNAVYGAGMSTFVVAPLVGAGLGELAGNTGRGFTVGVGLGVTAFVIGIVAGVRARDKLHDAIHHYNRSSPP